MSVTDADAIAGAVELAGGQTLMAPMDVMDAGRLAVFLDPVGAQISIWQPATMIGCQLVDQANTFSWSELATRSPVEAIAFYTEVFGWKAKAEPQGPVDYVVWQNKGKDIGGLMPMDDNWPAEIPSHWMIYFAVADTDAAAARVAELGGTVQVPPTDIAPGRFAVVTDPQGAFFSIITMADQQ